MARLSKDIPLVLINILQAVDYSKITDAHYDAWMKLIKENIGKHLKLKTKQIGYFDYNFPLRGDFCDLINQYDFNISPLKIGIAMPLVKKWANENLPLKYTI
jgi:adenine-specific DNA methylase